MSGSHRATPRGTLYLVATPIGNLEDITLRALRILKSVALVAAEDTRKAAILLGRYQIQQRTCSFFVGNEQRQMNRILEVLQSGKDVAIISEAGLPTISDPGATLVRHCIEEGFGIDVVPGASAIPTALLLSGFSGQSFQFLGFLPRKGASRETALSRIRMATDPVVCFEAPTRLARTLKELSATMADRPAAIARELTKRHQEVRPSIPCRTSRSLCRSPTARRDHTGHRRG